MYSYDVPAAPRRSTASRAIPGMRPSYDAEHPHSATPIYDELYSEYRRLFRALPGDRSGEEDLVFAGFAVRDNGPGRADHRGYPPQHQAFQTWAGQAIGLPQFMPSQPGSPDHNGPAEHHGHTGQHGGTGHSSHTGQHGQHGHGGLPALPAQIHAHDQGHTHTGHTGHAPSPYATGFHPVAAQAPSHPQSPAQAQFGTGQGWVAAGYLGSVPHSTAAHLPAPAPVTVPVPAPVPAMGTAHGPGGGPGTTSGGRHRSLLSLPPGRSGDHH
ncbi:hypothetical protein ACIQ9P_33380 [Kitasatospora sp. NPDC094019]|uniref:hypothetical protein n=1 Tax=Kitasatospora sp. NPDC094019 TaxID=3364091 RepID=UPI0037F1B205